MWVDVWCCIRYLHRHTVFTPTLGMLHLIYDLWHRHSVFTLVLSIYIDLGMLHLIYDLWLRHSVFTLALGIYTSTWYLKPVPWHLIFKPGTWYMTYFSPDPDPWYTTHVNPYLICYKYIDLTSWPLTRHYHPWYLYYMTYSWLSLLRGLGMTIILLPNIWYSWTPVLLNPWKRVTPDIILLFP